MDFSSASVRSHLLFSPTSERPQTLRAHRVCVTLGVVACFAGLGYCLLQEFAEYNGLKMAAKPIPALFMGLISWVYSVDSEKTWRVIFLSAFVMCALGDFLLQNEAEDWFMYGLGAFFVAHALFLASFSYKMAKLELLKLAPFLIFAACGLRVILAYAKSNHGAIVCYVFIEALAGWRAVARVHNVSGERSTAQWLGVVGMTLFMISDCFLAINRFVVHIPFSSWLILPTYWGALACLTKSARRLKMAYVN